MAIKSFQKYIQEALLDVDAQDVNKIYAPIKDVMKDLSAVWNRHIDRFMDASAGSSSPNVPSARSAVARTISRELHEVIGKYQPIISNPIKTFDSSQLKSENAKKAHEVNPIKIHVWVVSPKELGNLYAPKDSVIHIGLPYSVADVMLNRLSNIPNHQINMLKNEISELKHKSTIRHELTHWIDDSLHNFYIRKGLNTVQSLALIGQKQASQKAFKKMVSHGEDNVYLSPVEINAMVNQIAEFKRRVGKKQYDSMSWAQLMVALPSLSSINQTYGVYWRKKMFERMSREGLIGKNFQKAF
jgi:hypothetical protein